MMIDTFWIFNFCLSTVAVLTESPLPEHKTYVTDALSQNAFVIKTWTYRGSSLIVTVRNGNETLLSEFVHGVSFKEQENRLFIKYNNSREEVSLLLNNVTRDDEGLYKISVGIFQNSTKGINLISKTWSVQLNVIEASEIKQGYAGETILITEFQQESILFPRLYHNYQLIAVSRGSDYDLSTNSPFYGRIRCSKATDNNTTRIEINHVTENDTGLYTVEAENSLTQRCFLNITGTFTDSVSALTIVTPQDRFDEMSTTVLTGTAVNQASSHRELIYILPITTVAVLAIILFFGTLIWTQRRNFKSFKAVQRIVLETMDTASSAAFSTLGRCPHTPTREEIWTSNVNSLENRFTYPTAGRFLYPSSMVSTSGHISCHNNTQQLDDDFYKSDVTDTILKICQSPIRSNKTLLAKCHACPDSLIDACPFPSDAFFATEREERLERRICNANRQSQITPNTEDTYAEVKKSSRNNVKAAASCTDGYEMVDFSHLVNATNKVQDVELALRREPQTQLLWSYDEEKAFSGRKDEQGEEITLSSRKEEQGEEKALSGRKEEQGEEIDLNGRQE